MQKLVFARVRCLNESVCLICCKGPAMNLPDPPSLSARATELETAAAPLTAPVDRRGWESKAKKPVRSPDRKQA